jgi:hypothetical protein
VVEKSRRINLACRHTHMFKKRSEKAFLDLNRQLGERYGCGLCLRAGDGEACPEEWFVAL